MGEQVQKYALIVAGGTGKRMQAETPKQFLELRGLPVLMHTILAFAAVEGIHIIVVLPPQQSDTWTALCERHHFNIQHSIVTGGDTRFHSVRNGLELVQDGLVAIHDGARPLINPDIIRNSFDVAAAKGNAITAVKMKDSLREVLLTGSTRNANRANFYAIQTPQTFQADLIKAAYAAATHYNFTDDAGVLEEAGKSIHLIEGEYRNIKLTTPEDLVIAEALMGEKE